MSDLKTQAVPAGKVILCETMGENGGRYEVQLWDPSDTVLIETHGAWDDLQTAESRFEEVVRAEKTL